MIATRMAKTSLMEREAGGLPGLHWEPSQMQSSSCNEVFHLLFNHLPPHLGGGGGGGGGGVAEHGHRPVDGVGKVVVHHPIVLHHLRHVALPRCVVRCRALVVRLQQHPLATTFGNLKDSPTLRGSVGDSEGHLNIRCESLFKKWKSESFYGKVKVPPCQSRHRPGNRSGRVFHPGWCLLQPPRHLRPCNRISAWLEICFKVLHLPSCPRPLAVTKCFTFISWVQIHKIGERNIQFLGAILESLD